jgi:hypothetical protein
MLLPGMRPAARRSALDLVVHRMSGDLQSSTGHLRTRRRVTSFRPMERTKIEMIAGSLLRPTLLGALGFLPVGVWTSLAMAEQAAQAVLCNPTSMSRQVSVGPSQGWPCSNDPLPLPPVAVAAVSGAATVSTLVAGSGYGSALPFVVFDAVLDEPRGGFWRGAEQNGQAGPALHLWRPNDWAKLPRISTSPTSAGKLMPTSAPIV